MLYPKTNDMANFIFENLNFLCIIIIIFALIISVTPIGFMEI